MSFSAMRKKESSIQEPTINITPLIDVVFVVLIAFIMVAPLLERDEVQLADSDQNAFHHPITPKDASPIQIHVLANNTILFQGTPVPSSELTQKLRALKKRYPDARAQVFHDKRAHFGTYQKLKNSLEAAGFLEMDIVLSPS